MPNYSAAQKKEAVRLYETGLTAREVHERTGISVPYVKNLVHAAGVVVRPSGFQLGNPSRTGKPHTESAKVKIRAAHKASGHAPSLAAVQAGQPKTLQVRWGRHVKNPVSQLYKIYKRDADKRDLDFRLSLEDFGGILRKGCAYCGAPPSVRVLNRIELTCNGVDRLDSSKGYTLDNCVPCCKVCNRMKLTLSAEVFIQQCLQIARFRGKCQDVA